jgi:hypothetical protein
MSGGNRGELVRTLRPGELAWIAAVPCAIATVAAILVLGPPIGHAFFEPGGEALWPPEAGYAFGHPYPVKEGRYLAALLGPLLLAGAVLAAGRWRRRPLRVGAIRVLVAVSQVLGLAFLVACFVAERRSATREGRPPMLGDLTLAVAAGLTLAAALAVRGGRLARRVAALARETHARRVACLAVATAAAAIWLLIAVDSEATIERAQGYGLMAWSLDDPFALLNGRTPLVDFHAMYAQLVPWISAGTMKAFGETVATYTLTLVAMSTLALLTVYVILRRLTRSSPLALALFLPLLAFGFMYLVGPPGSGLRISNAQVFSVWPMRYAGPYLLAWLTLRHLDGGAPRRLWVLFAVGWLVVINNLEFGAGALAGTVVALACAQPPRSWAAAARLAGDAAAGLAAAVALVCAITLVHAGELPHPGLLTEFPRLFGSTGLVAQPIPTLGLHLVLYATFAAAIGVAVARVASGAEALLTSMLAWSGVFGLIAGSYFVGRADTFKLTALFSAWGFALALLTIAAARSLAAREWRPGLAELLVLFGLGLSVCALAETPAPWSQIARLGRTAQARELPEPSATRFVASRTHPGERAAILIALGHRIAQQTGIVNVSPYSVVDAISTRRMFRNVLGQMRRERAHALFLPNWMIVPGHYAELKRDGFALRFKRGRFSEWSDDQPQRR